ncbi:unnamed protein product [Didymodactylos carnosus]|uniref:MD-2-related lipid-recognition domain-containing protein n=1 Tax=Didymodactylos carnosus TaxID=1234261 RepID=A0A815AGF9_9BILA|nr:unnamed protein product [Didymodactylos carnosus]CAF1257115.1 unnamed protein product [Didymodactylos carnosus]CAF3769320.1 unnamed protein product [Didymodactylos carnosus]CAF4031368.1 unnamed protein product [Didymodactylos carnosus]
MSTSHESTTVITTAATTPTIITTTTARSPDKYEKFEWKYCNGSSHPGVEVINIDLTPAPLLYPGDANFTFIADIKRGLIYHGYHHHVFLFSAGAIIVKLDILRIISGITLPVRCYIVDGKEVGSCKYKDLCVTLQALFSQFNPRDCPQELFRWGIDCKCPFNIPASQRLDVHQLFSSSALSAAQTSFYRLFASGIFNIKVEISDIRGPLVCLELRFTIKPTKKN